MMKYVAGGLAVGLGQGLTETARQNGIAKRDAMLAQMEDQRSRRDRDWRQQDRREDRELKVADRAEDREWTVADRNDERSYQGERDDKLHGRAVDLEGLSQRHRLALEDKRARQRFEQDEISHGRDVALRNLDSDLAEGRDEKASRRDRETKVFDRALDTFAPAGGLGGTAGAAPADATAMTREVEYLANTLASSRGEQLSDAHRLEAVRLRRSSSGDDAEQQRARQTIFSAMNSDRRDRRTIEEKWAEASRMAGLEADSEPPPAQPAPAGLGAGVETVPAAGPSGAQEQPAPAAADGMPRPTSAEEYQKLPSGTVYMAPDGSVRTKP